MGSTLIYDGSRSNTIMRAFALLVVLVIMTSSLAGCIEFFTPQDPGEDGETDNGTDSGTGSEGGAPGTQPTEPGGTTPSEPAQPSEPGGEPTGGSGSGSGGSGSGSGSGSESEIAPPKEQRQSSPSEIDRPGEYALLPKGTSNSAASTPVPTWAKDQTWRYRSNVPAIAQSCVFKDEVTSVADTLFEVGVNRLTRTQVDCGERSGDKETGIARAHGDLMEVESDGYVEHELVFPLEDGKKWRYMRKGNATVDVTVDHVAAHLWSGQLVEAWHVTLQYSTGSVRIEKWYGVEAENYLREEIWATIGSAPTLITEVDLVSYAG